MGNTKQSLPKLQKFDVEILLDKIFQHMLLKRDRKINELAQKEIQQREAMKYKMFSYEEVSFEFISIVSCFNYIQAVKIIMRYCKSLKDYSLRICRAQQKNDFDEIEDLQPYIEGIIWSAEKLNLSYIKEFNNMIYKYFGNQVYERLRKYNNLDSQLKGLFTNIEPSTREIQNYLKLFLKRYNLKMKDFPENEGGNSNGGSNGQGGKKDNFMDQINDLKFSENNKKDESQNFNINQQQDYKDVPLDYQNMNNQQQNQQGSNSGGQQPQDNNFMNPNDIDYPAFDNQNDMSYKPQYEQENQQKAENENEQNFDDMINKLDEDNGLSGLKKDYNKRQSAMDQQSEFVTKEILPTKNDQEKKNDFMIGKKINENDLDYEATKYYINSLIGKDNDYKIDLDNSMKPDEKN